MEQVEGWVFQLKRVEANNCLGSEVRDCGVQVNSLTCVWPHGGTKLNTMGLAVKGLIIILANAKVLKTKMSCVSK